MKTAPRDRQGDVQARLGVRQITTGVPPSAPQGNPTEPDPDRWARTPALGRAPFLPRAPEYTCGCVYLRFPQWRKKPHAVWGRPTARRKKKRKHWFRFLNGSPAGFLLRAATYVHNSCARRSSNPPRKHWTAVIQYMTSRAAGPTALLPPRRSVGDWVSQHRQPAVLPRCAVATSPPAALEGVTTLFIFF